VRLEQAQAMVDAVVSAATGPVSVFVADDHGELVAAATMDGAAHDPAELASFDPEFIFFKDGVAAFEGERRVGTIGVSGLPREEDERLAREAIERAGLAPPPA